MPKVSVIIPCYNLGIFLGEAIASVRAQTFDDYEIIVVDDGSTDDFTRNFLDHYRLPSISILRLVHEGVSAARNAGIAAARGEYILPLDADDRIAPDYMEKAVEVLDRRPEIGIVYCKAEFFGELEGEWLLPDFSLPHMLVDNQIFSAAFFRRSAWMAVGGYNETLRTGWEDWDFWLRLIGAGCRPLRLEEILFAYRIRSDSREHSMGLCQKLRLLMSLVISNPWVYMSNSFTVVRILLAGDRRAPGPIKGKR